MYQHCIYLKVGLLFMILVRFIFMKVQAKVQKWGNGLAIRIAGAMRDIPRFTEGMPIEVEIFEDRLEIRKLQSQSAKRLLLPFSESDLLKKMTPKTAHAEIIATPLKGEY